MDPQPNLPQPTESLYHPKHHIKVYVWIALVVAAFLVAINGYLYFLRLSYLEQGFQAHQEGEQKVQELKTQRSPSTDPTGSPQTSSGQFEVPSNRQTYRNEEYGFEFKYPDSLKYMITPFGLNNRDFIITIWKPYIPQMKSDVNDLTIYDNFRIDIGTSGGGGISSACNVNGTMPILFLGENIEANIWGGWKCSALLSFSYKSINFSVSEDSISSSDRDANKSEAIKTFNQILSTFRFIK